MTDTPTLTPLTHDFGNGPVPAHRHPHGRGWVANTAHVAPTAYVGPDAKVYGKAHVTGSARVSDTARVFGSARVVGSAVVSGSAQVYGSAVVSGSAHVCNFARVYGNAQVCDNARVCGYAHVRTGIFVCNPSHDNGNMGSGDPVVPLAACPGGMLIVGEAPGREEAPADSSTPPQANPAGWHGTVPVYTVPVRGDDASTPVLVLIVEDARPVNVMVVSRTHAAVVTITVPQPPKDTPCA